MNILCEPSALNPILLDCIGYSGYQPAAKLGVLREQCVRHILFQKCSTSFVFTFLFFFFYRITSTGAVLLWVSFLLLGQVKSSWSFVARVFLHSLNQPKAFCSACGTTLVLACSSPSASALPGLLITSQDGTKILTRSEALSSGVILFIKAVGERVLQIQPLASLTLVQKGRHVQATPKIKWL